MADFWDDLIFLDTETTGIDPKIARVIELATGDMGEIKTMLISPEEPLTAAVQAMTTISNRMIAGAQTFAEQIEEILDRLKPGENKIYVAHNAEYDRRVLRSEFLRLGFSEQEINDLQFLNQDRWICTMRLAKQILKIDPEKEVKPSYALQFLRYYLDLPIPDDIGSHRADVDVMVLREILRELVIHGYEAGKIDPDDVVASLIHWSVVPIKIEVFPFGKHKDVPLKDIPNDYYQWAFKNMDAFNEDHPNYNQDLVLSVIEILESRT